MTGTDSDIDGRFAQGWGGRAPHGCHVNVLLARRGSPTAAAITTTFTTPSAGFTPILVSVGPDQPSYETLYPPTVMLNKTAATDERTSTLLSGAAQLGIAQGVLDTVEAGLLTADQDTLVFVAVWLDPAATEEQAVRLASREATAAAAGEAVRGRTAAAANALVRNREELSHPFYTGG
ncbi:formaldehyde-activating enzyme [Tamaricihabitans halophyticus]|uniref:Formaldehyde-activating enzyme n=1 Tax=Tamaricihabitans halophyticus TaxID=1262583 RepID=A0A4V2SSS3_9PSEU|nr:formaldehyde-activating enzyme [Tamaricihabitans halophyticus]TCP47956.1 formaldehyde-activating enzyme [Tamaricihabitans halophyticus]